MLPGSFLTGPTLITDSNGVCVNNSRKLMQVGGTLGPTSTPPPVALGLRRVTLGNAAIRFVPQSAVRVPCGFSSLGVRARLRKKGMFRGHVCQFHVGKLGARCARASHPRLILRAVSPNSCGVAIRYARGSND